MSALRKSGIDVLGDIPWGSHYSYFYQTTHDLLETLVPYFIAGLRNKEFCLWIVSNSELLTVEEAREGLQHAMPDLERYLAEGSIEIVSHDDWFLNNNTFDLHWVANRFKEKLDEALARGYAGMRVNGSPAWLQKENRMKFCEFEEELNRLFPNERIIASCTFPLTTIRGDEIFDITLRHQFAIARRYGRWDVIETPELKQAKDEIKKLNEELEQRVADRTKELAETNTALRKEIAERKHAEALLHAKEQEFRVIVENAPDLIARYDREFRRTYVNPAFNKSYDMPTEDLIGKPMFSIIREAGLDVKEDELTKVRQLFADVFETGKSCEFEITLPLLAGRRDYSVGLFPELDANGSVINVLSIARDITERKHVEDVLRKNEDRIRLIIDTIPTMVWTVQPDGTVDFFNKRWLEYAGEAATEEPNRIVHPEDLPGAMEKWLANMVVGKPTEDEIRLRRADGEYRWFLVRTAPLRDEQGNVIKWYGVSIDIEESKCAEETLKQSYEEIRRLSEHLQKIREEERRSIAREIHDELGQQLTAIKMDVVWIDKKLPGEVSDIKRKLKNIIGLLDGSDQSIRKILSELRPKILDDHGLLEAIKWLGRQFTETTGIPVGFTATEEEIKVSEQIATCMFRVCQEALTNITRYSHAKKVSVSINIFENNIKLIIEDDGTGFDTASVQNKNSFGILGMKERVLSLGGAFELVSSPGKGTKITASLPYKE